MLILTTAQMKHLEDISANMGVDHMRLMENAGSSAARKIKQITEVADKRVAILCGKGNNGGDSAVVARKFLDEAKLVTLIVVSSIPSTKQAYAMFERVSGTGVEILQADFDQSAAISRINNADIIVDGIFGTGFCGEITGKIGELVAACNNANKSKDCKFSLDIPSGVEGDSGNCSQICFNADYTIVFAAYKPAQYTNPAVSKFGKIIFADIAIPKGAYEVCRYTAKITDKEYFLNKLKPRRAVCNKGDFGKLLNISGSKKMTGAAFLSTQSALRSGAGLVTLASSEYACKALAPSLIENIFIPLKESADGFISEENIPVILKECEKSTAVMAGCGLGLSTDTKQLIYALIENCSKPLIIDADGINAISENINILKTKKAPIIITPHPGEMARLIKSDVAHVMNNRVNVAKDFAKEHGVYVVLKGNGTIIASPDGSMHLSDKGNPCLAKGGSGDVLTGIIGALSAQGLSPFDAGALGVYAHGMSGDLCADAYGICSVVARDIIEMLKMVFKQLNR